MSKAKDKGRRFENEIADFLTENGIYSERVPLSGSFGGKYDCDVIIGTPEAPEDKIECKYRENISMQLWEWLDGDDFLAVRRNRQKALFIMRPERFVELYKCYKENNQKTEESNLTEEQITKMYNYIHFVAQDRMELSHDKIKSQRDEYVKQAQNIIDEINSEN